MVAKQKILLIICICIFLPSIAACGNNAHNNATVEGTAIEETESSSAPPDISFESIEAPDMTYEEADESQNESIVENPSQVISDLSEWKQTDILVSSVPEDAGYEGATNNGFFYSYKDGDDWKYYFYSFSGETICVFEQGKMEEGTYSATMMTANSLLLTLSHANGATTYQIFEDGMVEEIYTQTDFSLPQRYCVNDSIYFTQNDYSADGSMECKVLRYNRNTSELDVIYRTGYDEKGIGRVVSRIGGTDEELFLAEAEYLDTEEIGWMQVSNWYVVKLDPDTGTVLAEIEEPYGILNVGGSGNRVLIAENSSEVPLPESGKIYMWEDSLSSAVPIPGWTASNHVWFSMLSGSRVLMYSAKNGYIWDLETDRFHIADFSKLLETSKVGMSSEGFSGLVLQEDGMHWREIRLIQ